MFKIGNSKELPVIPEHLSDDGKDFVRLCLQRNPHHRPTAAQLLEHPFVKHAAPVERPILISEPSDTTPGVTNGVKILVHTFSLCILIHHSVLFQKVYGSLVVVGFVSVCTASLNLHSAYD